MVVKRVVVGVMVHVVVDVVGDVGRDSRWEGPANGPRLALGRGGRVFDGALRPSCSLLLVDESPPAEGAAVGAVAHVHRAVAGRLNGEQWQVTPSEPEVAALGTRGASPAVAAAPALGVPAVLARTRAPQAPVLGVSAAGGSVQGQRRTGQAVVHIERDIAVGGGRAVPVGPQAPAPTPLLVAASSA